MIHVKVHNKIQTGVSLEGGGINTEGLESRIILLHVYEKKNFRRQVGWLVRFTLPAVTCHAASVLWVSDTVQPTRHQFYPSGPKHSAASTSSREDPIPAAKK